MPAGRQRLGAALVSMGEIDRQVPRMFGRGLIKLYRYTLSPMIGYRCRHLPTC